MKTPERQLKREHFRQQCWRWFISGEIAIWVIAMFTLLAIFVCPISIEDKYTAILVGVAALVLSALWGIAYIAIVPNAKATAEEQAEELGL